MSGPIRPAIPITAAVARTSAATTFTAATVAATAARIPISDVVVDLGASASRANILRDGKEVATPVVNIERAASVLENFIPIARINEPRSVRQSIAAGTIVTRGTVVDVDFLAPEQVTLGIFEGVHADLRARSVTSLAALLADPEVSTALAKPDDTLTAADRQNLTVKLQAANVGVDDTTSDRSLGAALVGLRTAQAFR